MLIEGNVLIGLLVGLSLAIAVIVVVVRFALKRDPDAGGSGFPWFGRGHSREEAESGEENETAAPLTDRTAADDLSLPPLDDLEPAVEQQPARAAKSGGSKKDLTGLTEVVKDLFGSLLGKRKKKEDVKRDVQDIDDQLNQVLQESQNLGLDIPTYTKGPDLNMMSDGKSMRDIDKDIRTQQAQPEVRKTEAAPQQPTIVGLNPYTQGGGLDLNLPEATGPQNEPFKTPDQNKPQPEASKLPAGGSPQQAAPASMPPENTFKGAGALDATHDLLSEIAAESVKEEVIDMSIMKDLQGVPIGCEELEKDLTGILDQVSVNVQRGGKKKTADKPGGNAPLL